MTWRKSPSIRKIRIVSRCGQNILKRLAGGAAADAFGSAIGKGLQPVAGGMDMAAEPLPRVQQMRDDAVASDGADQ
ncbi:hypothetical protein GCM10010520_44460 [Rhizobium viscosum]|uniref:Uncharacterized protein n=1 Tax=Rhizobium viscosum TaxID=1673 RepID=A0ABR9IPL4_RHIVS|nr:hypothetical protein [Rhizobium viscosum]MBE1504787.1 hypothetical protein [Rhizobium viscosum]